MARLIDDILAAGRIEMPWFVAENRAAAWGQHIGRLFELLKQRPPVILCDNVSEYYFTASDQEHWDLGRDFPNLAPPYEMFWTEHRMPKTIHSKECGDTDAGALVPNGRQGALFIAADKDDCKGKDIPENTRWIMTAELFIDYDGNGIAHGGHGTWVFAVDAEGRLIDRPWMQGFQAPQHNEIMKNFMSFFHPSLLAVSFMHCKNVRIVDVPVPPKLAKRYRERHQGLQPHAHKTLVIEPLKQILRTQGRSSEVGLAKAMHICRGHFADYTQGKGLFGKYHGKFWMPSTVRGTKGKKTPEREIEVKV